MKRIVFVLFTSMLFLTSCNGIKGDGNIVSQNRTTSEFYGITIEGTADVNVWHDKDYKVVVTTDNNLQDFVSVEAKNNILYINTKPRLKPTKLMVEVHLPELQSINLKGVGNVKLPAGNASGLKISLSGVGNIDAQNYQVENIAINHSGVGDAIIWATNSLSGTLSGVGDIRYKGNPRMSVNINGVGKVAQL
jgi:hypothetical protein